ALLFRHGAQPAERTAAAPPKWTLLDRPGALFVGLAAFALINAAMAPHGLALSFAKGSVEDPRDIAYMRWNSYSRVRADNVVHSGAGMWGPSPKLPNTDLDQRWMNIDGDAGTVMYRFDGDIASLAFLKYDITSLAHHIRNRGKAAVIGVGGGRDLLTAYLFGFRDVTGVELNPIFVDLL